MMNYVATQPRFTPSPFGGRRGWGPAVVERQLSVLPGHGWKTPTAVYRSPGLEPGRPPIPSFPQRREGAVRMHPTAII